MITQADAQSFLADYFAFAGSAFRYLIASVRKHLLSFVLIVSLVTAGSFYWWYQRTPYYETYMVCGYNNERFSRKNYGEMVQKLDMLAQTHSYNELAKLLHLAPGQTKTLLRLEPKNMAGSPLYEDITGNYQSIYFFVRATDKSVFELLQPALTNYLSNETYLAQIGAIELAKLNEKLALLQKDLYKVDSVIDGYALFLRHTNATTDSAGGFANIRALFTYKEELEDKMTGINQRRALQSLPSVTTMHGFAPPDYPTKGDRKVVWIGLIMGVVLAAGWAVFRNTLRNA